MGNQQDRVGEVVSLVGDMLSIIPASQVELIMLHY